MCIAIIQKQNKTITKEQFNRFSKSNNDGYGLIYVDENNKLITYKTLKIEDFYEKYVNINDKYGKTSPIVLHFRIKTSGRINKENCHPFIVDNDTAFVHNGVFYNYGTEEFSDTYNFNAKILSQIGGDHIFNNVPTQEFISDFIGSNNKLIFLNSKKEYIIYNEDEGIWKDDIWYSNKFYADVPLITNNRIVHNNYTYTCDCCKNSLKDRDFMTIKDYTNMTWRICSDCITIDTKISDVIGIENVLVVPSENVYDNYC